MVLAALTPRFITSAVSASFASHNRSGLRSLSRSNRTALRRVGTHSPCPLFRKAIVRLFISVKTRFLVPWRVGRALVKLDRVDRESNERSRIGHGTKALQRVHLLFATPWRKPFHGDIKIDPLKSTRPKEKKKPSDHSILSLRQSLSTPSSPHNPLSPICPPITPAVLPVDGP